MQSTSSINEWLALLVKNFAKLDTYIFWSCQILFKFLTSPKLFLRKLCFFHLMAIERKKDFLKNVLLSIKRRLFSAFLATYEDGFSGTNLKRYRELSLLQILQNIPGFLYHHCNLDDFKPSSC